MEPCTAPGAALRFQVSGGLPTANGSLMGLRSSVWLYYGLVKALHAGTSVRARNLKDFLFVDTIFCPPPQMVCRFYEGQFLVSEPGSPCRRFSMIEVLQLSVKVSQMKGHPDFVHLSCQQLAKFYAAKVKALHCDRSPSAPLQSDWRGCWCFRTLVQ